LDLPDCFVAEYAGSGEWREFSTEQLQSLIEWTV
jgi:hypothetical protein